MKSKLTEKERGLRDRNRIAERNRRESAARREIGEIPPVANPERRERTKNDFVAFCKEYGEDFSFFREWSPIHYEIAKDFEEVVLNGGKKSVAAPRGTCKTTFARWSVLWAGLQHPETHKTILYLGAVGGATKNTADFLMQQLLYNGTLAEDFPEVCYPILQYEGVKNRKLTHRGNPIDAKWSDAEIVLPTIEGSEASGSTFKFLSIGSGGIRGIDASAQGRAMRPSLVIVDDPQSDDSAKSEIQVSSMSGIIKGTVANLAGFDRKSKRRQEISIIAVCTCIAPNDLAMQLLDRSKSPDFRGSLYKRLPTMPSNMELWKQYKDIRSRSLGTKGDISEATAFYAKNQVEMDKGASSIDPTDFESRMLSGIQFGMDRWAEDEVTFWTEQQNDPTAAKYASGGFLSPLTVLKKSVETPHFHVPGESVCMTAHIDVGKHVLWYAVASWGEGLKFGHIVDYGVWPDQGVTHFRKETPNVSIQEYYDSGDESEKVQKALTDLVDIIFDQRYFVGDREFDIHKVTSLEHFKTGKPLSFLGLCGVDCSDGNYETALWNAIAKHKYRDRLMPLYGAAAKARLMRYLPLRVRESRRQGCDWICNPEGRSRILSGATPITSLKYDANTFKTQVDSMLLAPCDADGTMTLFHGNWTDLSMFADQMCSEGYRQSRIGSNVYNVWQMKKPQVADNDLFDCIVANAAMASFVGISHEAASLPSPPKRSVNFSEAMNNRSSTKGVGWR